MTIKTSLALDKRLWRPSPLIGQIVLVTTLNEDGQSNVAPKSWVSMMAFTPPTVVVGCNIHHWTARNALRSKEFVINVPGDRLAGTVWSSHALPHPRPVSALGLSELPAEVVAPPRIAECAAHLECLLHQHVLFGEEIMLVAEIVAASIDSAVPEATDPYAALRLIVYLEAGKFGVVEAARQVAR